MICYRAILLYYTKGNTNTQIATIVQCSRTTVIKVIKRAKELQLPLPVSDSINDKQLYLLLFPKRGRNSEYYYPNFLTLDHDRKKRGYTKYRAWQKYRRVCIRDGLKPYSKTQFFYHYHLFFNKPFVVLAPKKDNLLQIEIFEEVAARCARKYGIDSWIFKDYDQKREEWCKRRRLDKDKLWVI